GRTSDTVRCPHIAKCIDRPCGTVEASGIEPGNGGIEATRGPRRSRVAPGGARCGTALGPPEKSGPPPQRGYAATAMRAARTSHAGDICPNGEFAARRKLAVSYGSAAAGPIFRGSPRAKPRTGTFAVPHRTPPGATRPPAVGEGPLGGGCPSPG